jgi:class 3 adenylate cyclase
MAAGTGRRAAPERLPGPSLRAVYAVKATVMTAILVALWLFKLLIFSGVPALEDSLFIVLVLAPTLAIIRWRGEVPTALIAAAFGADIVAVTAGIHVGGGVDNTSGPILYALLTALGGLLVSAPAAFAAAGGGALCYGAMVGAELLGVLPHRYPHTRPPEAAVGTVFIVAAYLLLVALVVAFSARQIRRLHRRAEELHEETLGARTVTILFSDMEGFTAMTERLGDARAHEVMLTHHATVRRVAETHGGVEVDVQGDGFLLAFARPEQALRGAIALQEAFAAHAAAHPEQPIRVRIGIHTGEALKAGERFFGTTVLFATGMAAQARGGEIVVSARLRELVQAHLPVRFEGERLFIPPGVARALRVHRVAWTPGVAV